MALFTLSTFTLSLSKDNTNINGGGIKSAEEMERKSVGHIISSPMSQLQRDQTTLSSSLFGCSCSGSDQIMKRSASELALEEFIKRVYLRKAKIVIFHIKSGKNLEK